MSAETKICSCVKCGKSVEVTKFATPSKVLCDDCKGVSKKPSAAELGGPTKVCKCVTCGKDVVVTKFATASKVQCNDCKANKPRKHMISADDESDFTPIDVNLTADDIFHDDDLLISPALIHNEKLREVTCPVCGTVMRIIKIMDSSMYGDVISYQCTRDFTTVTISEQAKSSIPSMKKSQSFDYSGEQIKDYLTPIMSTRLKNIASYLLSLCEQNNIEIKGMGVFTDEVGRTAIYGEPEPDGAEIIDPDR